VLACPRCGGRLRLIALLEEAAVIGRILRHLGLPTDVPVARRARAPPLLAVAGDAEVDVDESALWGERPPVGVPEVYPGWQMSLHGQLDRVVTGAIIVRLRVPNDNSPALLGDVPWGARVTAANISEPAKLATDGSPRI